MNDIRIIGASAVIAAAALGLAGCADTSSDGKTAGHVEQKQSVNTKICSMPGYIRERAPAGVCTPATAVDDDMSLRRLHEERVADALRRDSQQSSAPAPLPAVADVIEGIRSVKQAESREASAEVPAK